MTAERSQINSETKRLLDWQSWGTGARFFTTALLMSIIFGAFSTIIQHINFIASNTAFWSIFLPSLGGAFVGLALAGVLIRTSNERQIPQQVKEERYEGFISSAADRFWESNKDHEYSYMSPPSGSMTRLPEDVIGITPWQMPSRQRNLDQNKTLQNAFELKKPFRNIEQLGKTPEGKKVYIHHSGMPYNDSDGNFAGFRGTITDATEEILARTEKESAENRFRAAMEELDAGFVLWDEDDRFVHCNSYFRELIGPTSEHLLLGIKFEDFIRQAKKTTLTFTKLEHDEWVNSRLEDMEKDQIDYEYTLSNGRWFRVRRQRLVDGSSIAFHNEITDRKSIEAMKDEFVAVASHELRTPITSILGSVKLLNEVILDEIPEKAKNLLEIAVRNSERLSLLVDDILDLGKIETENIDLNTQPIDVMDLVDQAVDLNMEYVEAFNCSLIVTERAQDILVRVDQHRMLQVLTNLISNAAKFSFTEEQVKIATRCEDDNVQISVTNHGPGIPIHFRDKVFEKFAQADLSDTRSKQGTGLGLSISKALVDLHGGELSFESELEKDTTFHIELKRFLEKS
jgi:PAS domain S-box-containing protein